MTTATPSNSAFGQRQVSTIYTQLNQYRVVMEVAPEFWQSPDALRNIHIQSDRGESVPSPRAPASSRARPRCR